jgi:dTDP-4-dehydrorhamnose reductase
MRLLVTGAGGMLGHDVVRAARERGHDVVGLSHDKLEVTDEAAVAAAIAAARPDAVVNCAAWTDVDGAESDPGARIVHVSTDYVFGGNRQQAAEPYVESDPTGPRSVYGATKLAGEQAVTAAGGSHAIVRSSWLFGLHGRNFVATMLGLGAERDEVRVVDDQIGCPTYTGHLAEALVDLAAETTEGIHHVAGGGAPCSWYELTVEAFRQAGVECRVVPCTTAEMPRPAPRPAFSALATERPETPTLPPWSAGLAAYLAARAVRA